MPLFFFRRSLIFKFGLVTALSLLLLFAPASFLVYKKINKEARESLRREVMTVASTASMLIDVEKHEKILFPEDEDTPLYEETRAFLKKMASADPRIDSIYTVRKGEKENIVYFVLDTYDTRDIDGDGIIEAEKERAHVGEEYDISELPEFQKGFNEVSADYEIGCDKWGCWLSGYAPLKDRTGKTVAVVGVDFSAKNVEILERGIKGAILAFIFFVLVPIFIILFFTIRFFLSPIKHLEKDIKIFAKDISHRSKLKTGDEFDLLVNQFNKMAERIAGIHKELEQKVQERTSELQKANKELKKTYTALLNVSEDLKAANEKLEETNKKLKETDEMRKEFVSHTAHELRTPLNVFRWSVEMLKSEDLGRINIKQREILDQIYTSNQRLLVLVNDLLGVSRIDEARAEVKIQPCQLEDLIDNIAGQFAVLMREKTLHFVWKKPKVLLPKIKADPNRVAQILFNILGNAVKFTPPGGKITVSVVSRDSIAPEEVIEKYGFIAKDKKYILVSISDTGFGIPRDEQAKMFSRFFRGSNVTKAQIEGTGLGMTIVFELIKLQGGAIWFESEEGVGTTFYFTLPVA